MAFSCAPHFFKKESIRRKEEIFHLVFNKDASYYSIDYSVNGGLKWKLLDTEIEGNFYTWKLTKEKPNTTYRLRVNAHDSLGNIIDWDDSDSNFTVQY